MLRAEATKLWLRTSMAIVDVQWGVQWPGDGGLFRTAATTAIKHIEERL